MTSNQPKGFTKLRPYTKKTVPRMCIRRDVKLIADKLGVPEVRLVEAALTMFLQILATKKELTPMQNMLDSVDIISERIFDEKDDFGL